MNAPVMTQAKPSTGASHVKPSALISGTFVTRDIARARRMCEGILGLDCVEPEKGVLLIRERGHRPVMPDSASRQLFCAAAHCRQRQQRTTNQRAQPNA